MVRNPAGERDSREPDCWMNQNHEMTNQQPGLYNIYILYLYSVYIYINNLDYIYINGGD